MGNKFLNVCKGYLKSVLLLSSLKTLQSVVSNSQKEIDHWKKVNWDDESVILNILLTKMFQYPGDKMHPADHPDSDLL